MDAAHVEILYEQGPCLVVLKPSGILTQAPPGIESLEQRLKAFLKSREGKSGNIYIGVPHRLDRPVSGAMLFARHVRACRRLSEQFSGRLVTKIYWTCVENDVQPAAGTWSDAIRKVPGQARAEIVEPDHPDGREAILHYRSIGKWRGGSWLEIELETGRMHQVRVQAAARGHAVLGDELYGSRQPFGPQFEDHRLRAIALHGRSLSFSHPMTRQEVSVIAPLPGTWAEIGLDGEFK